MEKFNNGVISIFRRKSYNRPQRKIIRIYTNGQTEINYFNLQKCELKKRCDITDRRNVKIIPIFENRGVKQILKKIKESFSEKDLHDGDRIYCVIDIDNDTEQVISDALRVKPSFVDVIFSNPNFEVWLLLHFKYYNQSFSVGETLTKLKTHLPRYAKPDIHLVFPMLKSKEKTAIIHAKRLREQHLQNQICLTSRASNPFTDVYRVVECLNKI